MRMRLYKMELYKIFLEDFLDRNISNHLGLMFVFLVAEVGDERMCNR